MDGIINLVDEDSEIEVTERDREAYRMAKMRYELTDGNGLWSDLDRLKKLHLVRWEYEKLED
jgi:hypothetical protein